MPDSSPDTPDAPLGSVEDLIATYAGLVRARCGRDLCPADADDATQAVFLVLWRQPDPPPPGPRLAAWLLATSRNVIRNALRDGARRRRAERRAGEEMLMHQFPDDDRQPDPVELRAQVDQVLSGLPAREQEAIELYYLAGHTYAEIAAATGGRTSTVAARVQRGLQRARQRMAKRGCTIAPAVLAGLLQANEIPAAAPTLLLRLREQAPSALPSSRSTGPVPDRIDQWAQPEGMSLMQRVTIASLAAIAVLGLASLPALQTGTPTHSALDQRAPLIASNGENQDTAPDDSATAATWAYHSAVVVRLNDPQRTWQRFLESPYASLLDDTRTTQIAEIIEGIGPAWLALDPTSPYSDQQRAKLEAQADRMVELGPDEMPAAWLPIIAQVDITVEAAGDSRSRTAQYSAPAGKGVNPSAGDFYDRRGGIAVADVGKAHRIAQLLAPIFEPSSADTATLRSLPVRWGNETGSQTMTWRDGTLLLESDSHLQDLDLAWLDMKKVLHHPEADLECYWIAHPKEHTHGGHPQEAHFDPQNPMMALRAQVTAQGLDLAYRSLNDVSRSTSEWNEFLSDAPALPQSAFSSLPKDALAGAVVALAEEGGSPFLTSLRGWMELPLALEDGSDGDDSTSAERQVLEGIRQVLTSARFQASAYVRPSPFLPSFTLELPTDPDAAESVLAALPAASDGQAVRNPNGDVRLTTSFGNLHFGMLDERLVITTDLGGVESVRTAQRGFDDHPDVQSALQPLAGEDTTAHLVIRHEALMQQVLPLLGMMSPDAAAGGHAFAASLPEEASWLQLRMNEHGQYIRASGALSAPLLSLPALPAVLPYLEDLPPMTID